MTERLGLNRQFACFEKFCCKEMHRQVDINHQRTHDDHASTRFRVFRKSDEKREGAVENVPTPILPTEICSDLT